jgi:hypothetical protein
VTTEREIEKKSIGCLDGLQFSLTFFSHIINIALINRQTFDFFTRSSTSFKPHFKHERENIYLVKS